MPVYRQRAFNKPVRVMETLAATSEGKRYNVNLYGLIDECGTVVGCIAGFCGGLVLKSPHWRDIDVNGENRRSG